MNAKGIIIAGFIGILLGAIGATITAGYFYDQRIGNLDSELRASRENYRLIEQQYSAITASNSELRSRLDSLKSGIGKAKAIAGGLSGEGQDAASQLRAVIEGLRKLKTVLEGIPSN